MEQKITMFKNDEFGTIRTLAIDGEPWFVGKDVTDILGYSNSRDALAKRVDEEDRGVAKCDTLGGAQNLAIINESGLYSLVLSSKLPAAKAFKRWITHDVIPSIRKHGAYITPEKITELMRQPETIIQILEILKNEQERNAALVQTNKALALDALTLDYRQSVVRLVRTFAGCRDNDFAQAWKVYYKNLLYHGHINAKSRHTRAQGVGNILDYIKPGEWPKALQIAVAMCENCGIDTSKVITDTNLKLA